MSVIEEMNHFYYQMSLRELHFMNAKTAYGGLSYNSLLYLDIVYQNPQCTVSSLAAALHVTKSAVTLKVNELMRQGALVKTQSSRDKRMHYLSVSPQMQNIYQAYDTIFTKIGRRMEQQYTPEQLALFGSMLRTISAYDWNETNDETLSGN